MTWVWHHYTLWSSRADMGLDGVWDACTAYRPPVLACTYFWKTKIVMMASLFYTMYAQWDRHKINISWLQCGYYSFLFCCCEGISFVTLSPVPSRTRVYHWNLEKVMKIDYWLYHPTYCQVPRSHRLGKKKNPGADHGGLLVRSYDWSDCYVCFHFETVTFGLMTMCIFFSLSPHKHFDSSAPSVWQTHFMDLHPYVVVVI